VPGIEHHNNSGDGVRCGKQKSVLHSAEAFCFQSVREKGHAAVSSAIVQKIHHDHHHDFAARQVSPEGDGFLRLQLRGFVLQSGLQKLPFIN